MNLQEYQTEEALRTLSKWLSKILQVRHEAGDRVLIFVANQINSIVKSLTEFVGRWGGEEFIYAAFDIDEEQATEMANVIMGKVQELYIPHSFSEADNYLSVSIGTSTINAAGKNDVRRVIGVADEALYLAKSNGRNCIKSLKADK